MFLSGLPAEMDQSEYIILLGLNLEHTQSWSSCLMAEIELCIL